MPAPTNTTPATAVVISSLPYSVVQTGIHDAGTTYTVYYTYTAQPGDNVLSIFGYGTIGSGYGALLSVLTAPLGTTPYLITSGTRNHVANLPVTPGDTYWFKFAPTAANPNPATLTLSVTSHADSVAPVGSIGVNDDFAGFPLTLLDATTSNVSALRYIQDIVAGEQAAVLNNGTVAMEERTSGVTIRTAIYDSNYAEIASVSGYGDALTCNRTDAFYAVGTASSNRTVKKFDVSGTVSLTTSIISTAVITAIGVSPDETILYYYRSLGSTDIKRWDLVNDIALTDLVTVAGFLAKDMVVLEDGRIVIGDATHDTLLILNTDGTTDETWNLSRLTVSDRIVRDTTDVNVWLWNKIPTDADEDFLQIQLSTGNTLHTITGAQFVEGVSDETETSTPDPIFGNSNSCPFWITRTVSASPPGGELNGPGGLDILRAQGRLVTYPIRRVRITPHTYDHNQRLFFSRFELLIQAGVGTVTGQGSDPTIELHCSNDGGFTWPIQRTLSAGVKGAYTTRAKTEQLGMARDRVWKVIQTDPVNSIWVGADVDIEEGSS